MSLPRSLSIFLCSATFTLSAAPNTWTLKEAEEQALKYNEQLLSLEQQVEAGKQRRLQAISSYMPSASLTGQHSRSENSSIFAPAESTTASVNFTQNLFVSDVYYANQSARIDYQSLRQQFQSLKNSLLFQLRQSYFAVLLAQEELKVQKENVDVLMGALKREQQLLDLGESTVFDVNQSKVAVANALSEFYAAVKGEKSSHNTLIRLLGLTSKMDDLVISESDFPVRAIPILNEKLLALGMEKEESSVIDRLLSEGHLNHESIFSDAEVRSWEAEALSNRPDIQVQESSLDQAKYNLRSKKAKYLPDLAAFATYDWTSQTSSLSNDKDNWKMGVSLSWNLFDSFNRERKIAEARKLKRSAEHTFQDLIDAAKGDVRDRIYDLEEGLMSYFAAHEGASLAEDAIKEARQRREVGVITALEYRDAASTQTKAKQNFNLASYRLLVAYYALKASVGAS